MSECSKSDEEESIHVWILFLSTNVPFSKEICVYLCEQVCMHVCVCEREECMYVREGEQGTTN